MFSQAFVSHSVGGGVYEYPSGGGLSNQSHPTPGMASVSKWTVHILLEGFLVGFFLGAELQKNFSHISNMHFTCSIVGRTSTKSFWYFGCCVKMFPIIFERRGPFVAPYKAHKIHNFWNVKDEIFIKNVTKNFLWYEVLLERKKALIQTYAPAEVHKQVACEGQSMFFFYTAVFRPRQEYNWCECDRNEIGVEWVLYPFTDPLIL